MSSGSGKILPDFAEYMAAAGGRLKFRNCDGGDEKAVLLSCFNFFQ